MITKWEDIPGVKKVHYGTYDTVVLIFEDDFATVVAKQYHDYEESMPELAGEGNEDALYDAMKAGAPGAQKLLDAAKAKFTRDLEIRERGRLAYLQKKYGGVK